MTTLACSTRLSQESVELKKMGYVLSKVEAMSRHPASGRAQPRAHLRFSQEHGNTFGDLNGIAARNQEAGLTILNEFGYASDACCNDRFPAGHCLGNSEAEYLLPARHLTDDVCGSIH